MMKKDYLKPIIELEIFVQSDVILASVDDDPYGDDKDWGEDVL
jgi:hypothetical protein